MKLKKIICIALAVMFVVAVSAIAIHAMDVELFGVNACCSNYRGTSTRVVDGTHEWLGEGCQSLMQSYCASCWTIFDEWYGSYNICPHY